jgi:hypothetical protein
MPSNSSFRDLKVWQESMRLVEDVYRVTRRFRRTNDSASHRKFAGRRFPSHRTLAKAVAESAERRISITWISHSDRKAKWKCN